MCLCLNIFLLLYVCLELWLNFGDSINAVSLLALTPYVTSLNADALQILNSIKKSGIYHTNLKTGKYLLQEQEQKPKLFGNSYPNAMAVKEQRVDGNKYINKMYLSCTLTGFERNHKIKPLSNQNWLPLFRKYSSISSQSLIKNPDLEISSVIHPWFITGFTDGEGSFLIRVRKNPKYKVGFVVEAYFSITLHKKDLLILQEIQSYFGGKGSIRKDVNNKVKFRVESLKDIVNLIIPHFEKYPLITQKLADYFLFKDVVNMMINKEHLTKKGLNKIVSIKAGINLGLPTELQLDFPDIVHVSRPLVENKTVPHDQWIAGFTSAEGYFKLIIINRPNRKMDQVQIGFQITQHSRDEKLLESFIIFFGCGRLEVSSRDPSVNFVVYKFLDNYEKILPFFKKHKILGVKSEDFKDWCKAAEIIKANKHLTEEGLTQLIEIKSGMNTGRSV